MELVVGSRTEIEAKVPKLSSGDEQQATQETPEEKVPTHPTCRVV